MIRYQLETALQTTEGATTTRLMYDTKEDLATALRTAVDDPNLFYLHITPINIPDLPPPSDPVVTDVVT